MSATTIRRYIAVQGRVQAIVAGDGEDHRPRLPRRGAQVLLIDRRPLFEGLPAADRLNRLHSVKTASSCTWLPRPRLLWAALVDAGADHGLVPRRARPAATPSPRGRACRSTATRLGLGTYPVAGRTRPGGRLARRATSSAAAAIEAGPPVGAGVLVGLATEGKRARTREYEVFAGDRVVGVITCGALSPTLGHPIAMAYVDADVAGPAPRSRSYIRGSRVPASNRPPAVLQEK